LVKKIVIRPNLQTLDVQIPVIINLDPENVETEEEKNPYKSVPKLIDKGLRAQLSMESLVTGQLMIDLDFHPEKTARLVGLDLGYPEIPTIPTTFDELAQTLKKVPIEEIFEKLQSAIESIEKILTAPELMDTVRSLNLAVSNVNKLINNSDKLVLNIDRQVKPLAQSYQTVANDAQNLLRNVDNQIQPVFYRLDSALENARLAFEQAEKTLKTYDNLVEERSEIRYKLNSALDETATAARSMRELTDYLKQRPDALLRGKGGTGGK
jgi:paraquat-inducible protein B